MNRILGVLLLLSLCALAGVGFLRWDYRFRLVNNSLDALSFYRAVCRRIDSEIGSAGMSQRTPDLNFYGLTIPSILPMGSSVELAGGASGSNRSDTSLNCNRGYEGFSLYATSIAGQAPTRVKINAPLLHLPEFELESGEVFLYANGESFVLISSPLRVRITAKKFSMLDLVGGEANHLRLTSGEIDIEPSPLPISEIKALGHALKLETDAGAVITIGGKAALSGAQSAVFLPSGLSKVESLGAPAPAPSPPAVALSPPALKRA